MKSLIKKYKVIIVLISGIFVCLLGMMVSSKSTQEVIDEPQVDIQQNKVSIDTETKVNVYYSEKDDDLEYNYITNPDALNGVGIYVKHIQMIPDEVNRVFKNSGYHGEKLEIRNVQESGTKIKFDIVVVSDNAKKQCEYSLRYGTFSVE